MVIKMLNGIDVSKWNTNPIYKGNEFVMARASCGKTYDRMFLTHIANATKNGCLVGAYHFAKTNNDWLIDATTFLAQCEKTGLLGTELVLSLDIEGADATRKNSVDWVENWLTYVIRKTGVKPLVYLQSSLVSKYANVLKKLDCGLWVAHWTKSAKPTTKPINTWTMWQYSDSKGKLDLDKFNGTKEAFIKYAKGVNR